ncbi:hypothetical protein [Pseudomonas sp. Q1-7]|uniref:hypothetical protein n=1 Tax=Pseudomonas sp. Q1-7 TaxID=3020843 RepID=UPI002300B8A6|nr:hypothetical protein [Pseudomonas sp. Q1-7]
MDKKHSLALLLGWVVGCSALNATAWQLNEVQECPTSSQNENWLDCTSEETPARLPYRMDDGSTQVLPSRVTAICKQGVCEFHEQSSSGIFYSTNEYAGQVQQSNYTPILLHRGYYLGNAADGRIVAYMKGSGPEAGGETAPALAVKEKASSSDTDTCVDKWISAFRKENGEEALIHYSFFDEWEGWCAEGKQP